MFCEIDPDSVNNYVDRAPHKVFKRTPFKYRSNEIVLKVLNVLLNKYSIFLNKRKKSATKSFGHITKLLFFREVVRESLRSSATKSALNDLFRKVGLHV